MSNDASHLFHLVWFSLTSVRLNIYNFHNIFLIKNSVDTSRCLFYEKLSTSSVTFEGKRFSLSSMDVSRIKFLDGFRFILALWVVGGHFYDHIGGPKIYELPEFFLMTLNKPIIAVYGFMIITGFLMMYNYLARQKNEPFNSRTTIIKFWLRRLFRLYPVYIIMVVIAFFTFVKVTQIDQENLVFFTGSNVTQWGFARSVAQPGIADLISHIFLIHGLFPEFHDSILGVKAYPSKCNFLFPFLC
jgi:hypothetical protein